MYFFAGKLRHMEDHRSWITVSLFIMNCLNFGLHPCKGCIWHRIKLESLSDISSCASTSWESSFFRFWCWFWGVVGLNTNEGSHISPVISGYKGPTQTETSPSKESLGTIPPLPLRVKSSFGAMKHCFYPERRQIGGNQMLLWCVGWKDMYPHLWDKWCSQPR